MGDLAIIDNDGSSDRDGLWNRTVWLLFSENGILGYRCDAAYQVPAPLWDRLISSAKKREPGTMYYAETLGCQLSQIEALAHVGFDYLFNSSKWWKYDQPWALEQHQSNKRIAPSIAFPESHDTERLASEYPGTIEAQKGRYAFESLFSKGLMMTMGFVYGANTRMDVVKGSPEHVDKPQWDLTQWIRIINDLKMKIPVLGERCMENTLRLQPAISFLRKIRDSGSKPVCVC